MRFLFLYIPLSLAIFLVVETIKSDDPKHIIKKTAINATLLTTVLAAVSAVFYLISKYL